MKKILTLFIALVLVIFEAYQEQSATLPAGQQQTKSEHRDNGKLQQAYKNRQSDLQIQGEGVVAKVLQDDLQGSRHQKFILKAGTALTVLVAHNIDLAPRIDGLKKGDKVEYYGEYEWNARGGVIHWTHKDPRGKHTSGWLKHKDRTYQ